MESQDKASAVEGTPLAPAKSEEQKAPAAETPVKSVEGEAKATEGNKKAAKDKCSKTHVKNRTKKSKKQTSESDSSSSSESDDAAGSSSPSSDSDDSESELEDAKKKRVAKKRQDSHKSKKKVRAKKNKKVAKQPPPPASESDTTSSESEEVDNSDDDDDQRSQQDLAKQIQLLQLQQQLQLQQGLQQGGNSYQYGSNGYQYTNPAYQYGNGLSSIPPPDSGLRGAHSRVRRGGLPPSGRYRSHAGLDPNLLLDGKQKDNKKKQKASKLDFKRVDQVWDNTIHNYKLQDTAEGTVDAQYDEFLFHVRRTFDWEGKYKATIIDIKSKLLRECLQAVMGNIKGVSLVEETPKLDPNMLFLYLEDLRKHLKELKKTKASKAGKHDRKKEQKRMDTKRQHLKILIQYIDKDYADVKKSLYPMLENGLITFDLIWALWKPNTLAFTGTYGSQDEPRVFKVEMAEKHYSIMKGDFYYIEGKYFEYDGKQFGFGSMSEELSDFRGARRITSLKCYPLKYHKTETQLRKDLIERGKKFASLSGVHYKSHQGMAYYKKKKMVIKVNINGRIMIDPSIHRRINPNYPISLVRPKDHDVISDDEDSDDESGCGCGSDSEDGGDRLIDDDDKVKYVTKAIQDNKGNVQLIRMPKMDDDSTKEKLDQVPSKDDDNTQVNGDDSGKEEEEKLPEFTDEEYLIASPVVLGFAFAEKLWLEFTVSGVKEIQWNESAYESLVLEPKTKDIVKALVESHKYHAAESIDDVIQGKGKGLVAVLHGPPGTGKTLTAEGISELLKSPLYTASAAELGTESRYLEGELQKILDICHAWGAILLLDEADVFLEKRNMHDIHRNALVSIFLRQLEYFQGILFLTTNRVETFDDAFQSRIHIALRYDNLDHRAKKAIFKIFIERVRVLEKMDLNPFTDEDFNTLARHELNGRQIKNTVFAAGLVWLPGLFAFLPSYHEDLVVSAIPAPVVTEVALRLRHLIEECVPCELDEDQITRPHSKIITKKVIKAAQEAGGKEHRACVVFCLLVNKRWWKHQSLVELWDSDLHLVRAVACEVLAKQIYMSRIETEDDMDYLLHSVLLKRYSIMIDGGPTPPANVVEKAVDLHALRIIGSSGYQKCINFLWRGWLVQDENDPATFIDYRDKDNTSFFAHLDPDRMRAPMYQNATQMLISFIYLVLYTFAINTVNPGGDIDLIEGLLYVFTLGFIFDELSKFWKAGYHILGFWTALNSLMYGLLTTSLVLRFIALSHGLHDPDGLRHHYNTLSYNFLAVSAPLFWCRLLLYLDSFRFFGAMLVVLKVMMKESIIFFALLAVIIIGFLQSFIGLDYADDQVAGDTVFIIQAMANAVMQSPDFTGFEKFQHPFGLILYYIFTFVVMVVLLNILIALYNSAYEDIYDNANDEYLCMFAHKCMLFVRAPDENVYIAPLNLIEIFLIAIPFEWWMEKKLYEHINDIVMATIYSPLLLVSAYFEVRAAQEIRANRARGDEDDDTIEEWEQMNGDIDFERDGWNKRVDSVKCNLDEDPAVVEIKKLKDEVDKLRVLIEDLHKTIGTINKVTASNGAQAVSGDGDADPSKGDGETG
ncbi:cation channel-like protein [Lasiosphaeria hispida]|uniref:Cation channel-like protein n=1 Tax=Lasiosphaeria hispida TaxID=260671 RepID=A0AAJ0HHS8_9PEZI|nr:cation channel-like protein [Lasiosphaeria hispida]